MMNRQKFLRSAGLGAAAAAGGMVFVPAVNRERATADQPSERMRVGRLDQAVNLRALSCSNEGGLCLTPLLLMNGSYAVPESVLQDPKLGAAADVLSQWDVADVTRADYATKSDGSSGFLFAIDNRLMRVAGRPSSLTMPQPDTYQFELQSGDVAGPYDVRNGNRRSEIISKPEDGVGRATVWASFCLILGATPGLESAGHGLVHQWHGVDTDVERGPVLSFDVSGGSLQVCTRSSIPSDVASTREIREPEKGILSVQYTTACPAVGQKTYVTLQAAFGEDGHLNTWINGNLVINNDTPIGYFRDLQDGSNRSILGYPHWGLYTTEGATTNVVTIANPEWGAASLFGRVAAPLPVP